MIVFPCACATGRSEVFLMLCRNKVEKYSRHSAAYRILYVQISLYDIRVLAFPLDNKNIQN